jgi:hypothetical protein
MRTGRRPWNSPTPRLTLMCPLLRNKAGLAPICNVTHSLTFILMAVIVEHRATGIIPVANR